MNNYFGSAVRSKPQNTKIIKLKYKKLQELKKSLLDKGKNGTDVDHLDSFRNIRAMVNIRNCSFGIS
jgi:hypothetical protein